MKFRKNVWDRALIFGLGFNFALLVIAGTVPSWWTVLIWPSYVVALILDPTTEAQKLICDLAFVYLGFPTYALMMYPVVYCYDIIVKRRKKRLDSTPAVARIGRF
jgi:hypothetical protein